MPVGAWRCSSSREWRQGTPDGSPGTHKKEHGQERGAARARLGQFRRKMGEDITFSVFFLFFFYLLGQMRNEIGSLFFF